MANEVITTSTKIADVIVPEIFTPYVIEKTAEKSKILQSGIATASSQLNQLVTAGGVTMQMPFWQDLQGEDEVLDDHKALTPGKINASKDIAALLLRGKAWGANDLAGALAGDDPMNAIAERVSDYWARREQKTLVSVLTGVFASTSMKNHVLDKSTAPIDGKMVLDGKQLLGDSADQLQAILMHSAVYTELQKQNLIQYTTTSDGKVTIPTYLTYAVVVDDGVPEQDGVYTTYLFARGVIARGEGTPVSMVSTETDRDSLAGEDYLINRRAFVLHPYGIKWVGQAEGVTPTNEELATGTNWERVYEDKNIGIVAIKHKIGESRGIIEPEPKVPIEVILPSRETEILGKKVSDLIDEDVKIGTGKVRGTVKYVDNFTEYSEIPEEQNGNYFPIALTGKGKEIEIKINGISEKIVPFTNLLVLKILNTDKFEIIVDNEPIITLNFSGCTLLNS